MMYYAIKFGSFYVSKKMGLTENVKKAKLYSSKSEAEKEAILYQKENNLIDYEIEKIVLFK